MKTQNLYKVASFVVLLSIGAMFAYQVSPRMRAILMDGTGSSAVGDAASPPGGRANVRRLSVGVINKATAINELPTIEAVPWQSDELRSAYKAAEGFEVQMLGEGMPVKASLVDEATGVCRTTGRLSALTIGLDIDADSKSKLPSVTRLQIIEYLRDHEIALQPLVHQTDAGKLYFGGVCYAAFYDVAVNQTTIDPEPLVQQSISRIRVLGVLGGEHAEDARTLVMAIRYAVTETPSFNQSRQAKYENELLFFHLSPASTAEIPLLSVFISSDNREYLHRLSSGNENTTHGTALMMTTIRFDSFVMMGIYPAEPVVTGVVPYRSVKIPVAMITQTRYRKNKNLVSLQALLDEYATSDDPSQWRALNETGG